jgi:hypothetical protein
VSRAEYYAAVDRIRSLEESVRELSSLFHGLQTLAVKSDGKLAERTPWDEKQGEIRLVEALNKITEYERLSFTTNPGTPASVDLKKW